MASIQVRADGVFVFAAFTDDSGFTVKAFLQRHTDKNTRRNKLRNRKGEEWKKKYRKYKTERK